MKFNYKLLFAAFMCFFISCKKEKTPDGAASLTVIHAVVGAKSLRTNFTGTNPINYSRANRLSYGTYSPLSNRYNTIPGNLSLGLYQEPDTLAKNQPLFLLNMNLPKGSINSLFLTGTLDAPESLLIQDQVPYYPAGDSAMGIRFINLSPGSDPISVNIGGMNPGSTVQSLAYKNTSDFIKFAIYQGQPDIVFEIRDKQTGDLLTQYKTNGVGSIGQSYAPNTWLFRNFTIVIIGQKNGVGNAALKALLIPYSV